MKHGEEVVYLRRRTGEETAPDHTASESCNRSMQQSPAFCFVNRAICFVNRAKPSSEELTALVCGAGFVRMAMQVSQPGPSPNLASKSYSEPPCRNIRKMQ